MDLLGYVEDDVEVVRGQRALLVDIVAWVERRREGVEVVERFAQPVSRFIFGHGVSLCLLNFVEEARCKKGGLLAALLFSVSITEQNWFLFAPVYTIIVSRS